MKHNPSKNLATELELRVSKHGSGPIEKGKVGFRVFEDRRVLGEGLALLRKIRAEAVRKPFLHGCRSHAQRWPGCLGISHDDARDFLRHLPTSSHCPARKTQAGLLQIATSCKQLAFLAEPSKHAHKKNLCTTIKPLRRENGANTL